MATFTQENRLLRITSPAFDDDYLMMKTMQVVEGISQLYEIDLELLHEEPEGYAVPEVADHKTILGQPVSIEVNQLDGRARRFNGIVSEFAQGSRGGGFTNYWMKVVPEIWISTLKKQSRIYQQKTVTSILKDVFSDFDRMIVWELEYDYKQRNYCVQYRETDFAFASRLMEEEGIYYYFEHVEDRHTMIISDKPRFTRNCPGDNEVTYTYKATEGEFQSHIRQWDTEYKLQSGIMSYRDHHIQQPNKKLAVTSSTKFKIGDNGNWEVYDFPGGYARKYDGVGPGGDEKRADLNSIIPDGNRTAQTAMEILDAQFELSTGESDVSNLTPGHKFTLYHHPVDKFNAEYVLTSVRHTARQSPAYGNEDQEIEPYLNEFTALAHGRSGTVPYRPARVTPTPIVQGAQTAYVVGPPGEEIYTDEYGRIKVQFFWDREGQTDGTDSCWLPVAQTWAGNGWGSMFIPRVGMEVIVHFLEGNPDNPIVAGCVYHPLNLPPYKLPQEKTKSTIKTDSTPGGNGFNELRFEDMKGEEQIFVHGEKDLDVRIKNDVREWTGNEEHLIVKKDRFEMIENDTHLIVKNDQIEHVKRDRHLKVGTGMSCKEAKEVTGSQTLKIGADQGIKIGGSKSEEVTGSMYLKGMNVVVEGMSQLTLKVGGNFVDINPAGVFIQGTMVMINSGGGAGSGMAVPTVPPTEPKEPDEADDDKPGSKMKLEKQSLERKKNKSSKEDPKKKSWIKLKMIDEEGNPVPGESYRIKTSDGKFRSGSLNHKGEAHVKGIEPGSCEVTFPNLDKDAWEDA